MATPEQGSEYRGYGRSNDGNVRRAAGDVTSESDASKGRKRADSLRVSRGKLRAVGHLAFHGIGMGSQVTMRGEVFVLGKVAKSNQCYARSRGEGGSWVNPVELETYLMEQRMIHCTHECAPYRPKFSDVVG